MRDHVLSLLFYLFYRERNVEADKSYAGIKIPRKKINKKTYVRPYDMCFHSRLHLCSNGLYFPFGPVHRYARVRVLYYFKSSLYALPM